MKKVILTGANGQLGQSFASMLVKQGFQVIAVDKNIDNLTATKELNLVKLDITNSQDVNDFYSELKDIYGLINNAGTAVFTPFEERTAEEFMSVVEVNLLGTFLMAQGAVKIMKNNQIGKIVNIGSIYGVVSSDERIYGQSKRNNHQTDDFIDNYNSKTPSGRMARPADFDAAMRFLLDENNSYTNGQNIVVDGGFTAW